MVHVLSENCQNSCFFGSKMSWETWTKMTEGARVEVLSEKGQNAVFWVKNEVFWSFRGQNGFKTPIVPY